MNDGFSLLAEIDAIDETMNDCLQAMDILSDKKALAEANYYRAKSNAAKALKDAHTPITHIQTVIKGLDGVNDKLQAFHSAEMEYANAKEALLVNKQRYKFKTELFKLEYGKE